MAKKATTRPPSPGPSLTEALRRHVRAKGAGYLDDPNITSVGIGNKNGDGPVCIQFTVGEKGDSVIEKLGSWRIPETIEVEGHTIPTDVIERDYEPSYDIVKPETLDVRRVRIDPIRPGASVANTTETAGTIGLIVFERQTGAACILSNWHVLHGNKGLIGDTIVQPGPFDDNNTAFNRSGQLLRSHLGPAGDCAIALVRDRDFDRSIIDLDVAPTRMARVELGDKLVKSGRTTGVTYGLVRRIDVMAKINYGAPKGTEVIGCFEIGVDPAHVPNDGEISMGGDSGAAWLVAGKGKPTDIFAGLHFAGESQDSPDEHALACYPLSVQKKLDFVLEPPKDRALEGELETSSVPRSGYDPEFLGLSVPMPRLSPALRKDAVTFGRGKVIPYTHFSVCLSRSRRMARFVAWNVDGTRRVILPRRDFKLDTRLKAEEQYGNELYRDNVLDRGHIARRADLCWGSVAEADQANRDSFFYTNIAPQHERFNQSRYKGLWGDLENLILEQAELKEIRLCVLGGPVFSAEDISYRGALVPHSFWKLIAYHGADDRLRCAAFVLSQSGLVQSLETMDFEPFRIHQVRVTDLGDRTGLGFDGLDGADVMTHPELVTRLALPEALSDHRAAGKWIENAADITF